MATLHIQIKGPCIALGAAGIPQQHWDAIQNKLSEQKSSGWYNVLEDDFFLGLSVTTDEQKPVLHWQDLTDLSLFGALAGSRNSMTIRHSNSKKGFRKTLNQLLEQGMLFPLFNNSVRGLSFDPESKHALAVVESRIGQVFNFVWEVPDMEPFNPEALEFCWVRVELFDKREFFVFTEVLYNKQSAKSNKPGKTMVKSWELLLK